MITQERLKELFYYNPEDGNLYNRININPRAKKDAIAGSVKSHKKGSDYIRRVIQVDGIEYKAHRLVWIYHNGLFDVSKCIDHIDGNPLNNRIENLRIATLSENQRNRKKCKRNTSGVIGVTYRQKDKIWVAQIGLNGTNTYIGSYKEFEDAVKARKEAEKKYGFHKNHGREAVQVSV